MDHNSTGRPVWKLPILGYGRTIDQDSYLKKREVLEKHHNNGDLGKVTKYLNSTDEYELLLDTMIGWIGRKCVQPAIKKSYCFRSTWIGSSCIRGSLSLEFK